MIISIHLYSISWWSKVCQRGLQRLAPNDPSWQHKIKIIFCSCLKAEIGVGPDKLSSGHCLGPQLGLGNLPREGIYCVECTDTPFNILWGWKGWKWIRHKAL